MEYAVFALTGVVMGVLLTLLIIGDVKPHKKKKITTSRTGEDVYDTTFAKREQQLMQQWQNLLSYGADGEGETHI